MSELFLSGTIEDPAGCPRRLHSHITLAQSDFLRHFIRSRPELVRTLEIGCAYGVSALSICDELQERNGAHHTIIDPAQMDAWEGIGVGLLERAGITFFELIAQPSEIALPRLLGELGPGAFGFVFIDGWHTFDQVVLDLYYATRLLPVGGCVAIHDADWPAVSMAIAYFETCPHLTRLVTSVPSSLTAIGSIARRLPAATARRVLPASLYQERYAKVRYPPLTILEKVAEDTRNWDFFRGM